MSNTILTSCARCLLCIFASSASWLYRLVRLNCVIYVKQHRIPSNWKKTSTFSSLYTIKVPNVVIILEILNWGSNEHRKKSYKYFATKALLKLLPFSHNNGLLEKTLEANFVEDVLLTLFITTFSYPTLELPTSWMIAYQCNSKVNFYTAIRNKIYRSKANVSFIIRESF